MARVVHQTAQSKSSKQPYRHYGQIFTLRGHACRIAIMKLLHSTP